MNAYRETNIMFYVIDEGRDFCTNRKKVVVFVFSLGFSIPHSV